MSCQTLKGEFELKWWFFLFFHSAHKNVTWIILKFWFWNFKTSKKALQYRKYLRYFHVCSSIPSKLKSYQIGDITTLQNFSFWKCRISFNRENYILWMPTLPATYRSFHTWRWYVLSCLIMCVKRQKLPDRRHHNITEF